MRRSRNYVMSSLLIGWWTWSHATNTADLQIIFTSDYGFIMSMAWYLFNFNSWCLQQIFLLNLNGTNFSLAGFLAAAGKSTWFGLHPWPPSATQSPPPVSALLHISVIVVTGIFLLIWFYPLKQNNNMPRSHYHIHSNLHS